jgi:hypothetical protein
MNSLCFVVQVLEQLPRVISSLDAHMENGLQKLVSFLCIID